MNLLSEVAILLAGLGLNAALTAKTFYYHAKREYAVAALAAGKVVMTDVSHPTKVTVNEEFPWYVVGHVQEGVVTNPGFAYVYVDGPADQILLVLKDGTEDPLPKGYFDARFLRGDWDICTTLDSRAVFRGAKFPVKGTYKIWLLTGRVSEDQAALGRLSLAGYMGVISRGILPAGALSPRTVGVRP